jgi:type I restriction enzyme R subunit
MTNFDFLKNEENFASFADVAITAEKLYNIDIPSCVFNVRRCAEFAVKWMYSVDDSLVMPYQDNFNTLIGTSEFKDVVGENIIRRLDFIRKVGNNSAHSSKAIKPEQAALAIENLFYFLDFVAYCYGSSYNETKFNPELLKTHNETVIDNSVEINFNQLLEENKALKEELTARRAEQQQTYTSKPLELSEYKIRKLYIIL